MNRKKIPKNEDRWKGFSQHFKNIDPLDAVTAENYLDIISMYKEAGREKIVVKHMYYGSTASITSFCIGPDGNLRHLQVWRIASKEKGGGYGCWDAELVKLMDRPKKRRTKKAAPKKKKTVAKKKAVSKKKTTTKKKVPAECKKHPNYGAVRSPRTDCKSCWDLYYHKHPDKK